MSRVFFYLFVKPLSLLPLWMLHGVSDFAWLVGYKIGRYRVKVVTENLRNSFPDKSPAELRKIRNQFYHHFADLLVESFKMFSITKEEALGRLSEALGEDFTSFLGNDENPLLPSIDVRFNADWANNDRKESSDRATVKQSLISRMGCLLWVNDPTKMSSIF